VDLGGGGKEGPGAVKGRKEILIAEKIYLFLSFFSAQMEHAKQLQKELNSGTLL
jgi:hypothetical protein